MKNYTVTSKQVDYMKHCIGFDKNNIRGAKNRKMESYRNYFITSDDDKEFDKLVDQGLMIKKDFRHGIGDNPKAYIVSEEGFKFLSKLTEIEITERK